MLVSSGLIDAMKKQKYHFVGRHSAVKRCRWLHETLVHDRPCYKQKFYGIKTHQCIQMTPAAFYCTQQCLFCWRAQNGDLQASWDELKLPILDSPEEIVEGSIRAQRAILTGSIDPTFKCPTVIRITSARGLNIRKVEGYAKLIEGAKPTYVEAKA